MKTVAVLFARSDSVYKTLPGCDVWDEARDARKWERTPRAFAEWLVDLARRCTVPQLEAA